MKKINFTDRVILILIISFICLGSRWALNGAVIHVTTTEDNVEGSLRAAITTAVGNTEADTIYLPAGTYKLTGLPDEDANTRGDLDIDTQHSITIMGSGKGSTFIEGNGQDRVFHILNGTVSISDLTIRYGGFECPPTSSPYNTQDDLKMEHGGGIHNNGTLTLENCIITGNKAKNGCYLIIGTGFGSSYGSDGGGIYNTGSLTMEDCTVSNNQPGEMGFNGLDPTPAGVGGGIYSSGTLNMLRCSVRENFTDTSADGAGIYCSGTIKLEKCTISNNVTGDGTGCRHCDTGTGGGFGGGIYNRGRNCAITDCTIENNETGLGGMGDFIYGVGGSGAGIYNCGTITLKNTAIINNIMGKGNSSDYGVVYGGGGGICNSSVGDVTLHNCTISGNSTGNGVEDAAGENMGGYGGGICNSGKMTLKSCTVVNNKTGQGENPKGGDGGGIFSDDSGECRITNTIIANNSVSPDRSGPDGCGEFLSSGYNLIEDTDDLTISGDSTGNLTGVDPMLASLADNGGHSYTHAPKMTSPAVDAGTADGLTTDQRGRARPTDMPGIANVDDGSDIGAFEITTSYSISGRITHSGTGVEGVALSFSNSGGTAYTDESGNYFHPTAAGWSGTVTPSKEDYTFTPSSRTYISISSSPADQDYTASAHAVSVTITNPGDGDTVTGIVTITATVSSQAADSTPQSVTRVEFYIDGELMDEVTAAPFAYEWDTGKSANGSHTVTVKAYNAAGQMGEDEITVTIGNDPRISLNRTELHFVYLLNVASTGEQEFAVGNSGTGDLNWTLSDNANWLRYTPESGTNSRMVKVTTSYSAEITPGTYTEYITVSAPDAANSPQTVKVTYTVVKNSNGEPPFGKFITPYADTTVMSSVPFTGWALDDVDLKSIKVYREPTAGETGDLIFIGDAVRVEGARPDIEERFPGYPENYKAGWGYMMLTNFLPDQGNGYFTFHVIAEDWEGHQVTLGTKTVFCDNDNAVKPFGAIDTPGQGDTVYNDEYCNFGWALTPQPNTIPKNGSTITVWVDGEPVGQPIYNNYRDDIYNLFPGLNNSEGAVGYFYLDTTAYADGVHTIAWSVEDDAGNADGIGSRYFSVRSSNSRKAESRAHSSTGSGNSSWLSHPGGTPDISNIPIDSSSSVLVKRGYNTHAVPIESRPDADGIITIEIQELERIEIRLFPVGTAVLAPLNPAPLYTTPLYTTPIGSTFNPKTGIFSWQPGPGFVGNYRLDFLAQGAGSKLVRKQFLIKIIPRFTNR
jgi:hypothetical protein